MQMLKAGDFEGGLKTMNMFVSDCGYNVNVHDNQTIWFELQSGNCLYSSGRYREALKQWHHVESHVEHMVDDHADYLLYSFRRFTLQAFEELIVMMDDRLFQNRYVIKNAINYLRLMHKVDKCRDQEREKHAEAMAMYKMSPEYEKLMKDMEKLEDEDEYKLDNDPEGYFTYDALIEKKHDMTAFVVKVCSKNPNAPELMVKTIKSFLSPLADGKTRAHGSSQLFFTALRAAINLHEHHRKHPGYLSGLAHLFGFWIANGEEYRTVIGDGRLYDVAA